MRDPIQRYFQVGLVSAMMYAPMMKEGASAWPKLVRAIAIDDYFDVVELNPLPNDEIRQQVKALVEQSHMKLVQNAHGRLLGAGLNPNDVDENGRQAAEDALIAGVDEAASMGSATMGMLSGRWTGETREECFRQLVKTVVNVCKYAQTKGILVELEVFDHDIAKCSLLGPAPLAARFAAEVRTQVPNFGLMVDLSHFPMTYETSTQVISVLRPYITHFHFGNTVCEDPSAVAYGDEHPRFGFPNSSNDTAEVLDFLRVLKDNGFFNEREPYTLTFEVKPWADEDIDVIIANSKRVLNRAWALLED